MIVVYIMCLITTEYQNTVKAIQEGKWILFSPYAFLGVSLPHQYCSEVQQQILCIWYEGNDNKLGQLWTIAKYFIR